MQVLKTKAELKHLVNKLKHQAILGGQPLMIGFVPTMGALHAGHISLIVAAKQTCQVVVASVFVNPAQFNDPTDFNKYPATPAQDILMLEAAGCDLLFMPTAAEIYCGLSDKSVKAITFGFEGIDALWEGSSRLGHFSGVALVLSKLFHLVSPTHVFMGQKDYQQLAVVRQLVSLLDFDLTVVGVPTLRSEQGLALSSRNARLSPAGLSIATNIYQSLQAITIALPSLGAEAACQKASNQWLNIPPFQLDYLAVVHPESMQPIKRLDPAIGAVIVIAIWLEGVRLIDNWIIPPAIV